MRYILLIITALVAAPSFGQTASVKQQAEEMGASLLRKDYARFVSFTYPVIVKQMGGPQKMAATVEQQMKGLEKSAEILSITFGEPSKAVTAGKEIQCIVPQHMVLRTAQGKILATSTLIAISTDKGRRWYFVDAGERDIASVRSSMPNVSRHLALPKPAPPQLLKD